MRQARAGMALWCGLALAAVLPAAPALAQEEGLRPDASTPFAIRDAFTQGRGTLQAEGFFGYEHGPRGRDRFQPRPGLKYGLTDAVELRLTGTYNFGSGSGTGRGRVAPGLQWRILPEQGWRPAVALLGEVALPLGAGDEGATTELMAITSWTTGRGPGAWGLHLNAAWRARPDPGNRERRHGYRAGAAVAHVLGPDTLFQAGYVQETQDRGERDFSLVEAGLQQRFGGLTFGVAAGAGLNDDSPRFRIRAGVKFDINLAGL